MKINDTGKTQKTGKANKSKKSKGSEGSFGDFIASAPKEAAQTKVTQSIVAVDALLAVQGAEDPTERASRGKMRQRAETILDGLDEIRSKMLQGSLTVGDMVGIADVVASHREKISDPKMTDLMDEIDLRAQVELAKMQMAMKTSADD
jgi:hypothetical protein